MDGNYTMVPFRFIGEALGAKVDWNCDDQSVTLTVNAQTIVLAINSRTAAVDGNKVVLDKPSKNNQWLYNGAASFCRRGSKSKVHWDGATKRIMLQADSEDLKKSCCGTSFIRPTSTCCVQELHAAQSFVQSEAVQNSAAKYDRTLSE